MLVPLMGRFAKDRFGQILDSFLVMGTIFGIATSVGFGIMQLASGLNTLFNIPTTTMVYQIIAAIWCAI